MKLTVGGSAATTGADPTLVTAVARAFDWYDRLATAQAKSISDIAKQDGFDAGYVSHLLRLAFLPPSVVEDVIVGRQAANMTADQLIWHDDIAVLWPRTG